MTNSSRYFEESSSSHSTSGDKARDMAAMQDDSSMQDSDQDEKLVFEPPPRVAARLFLRPSKQARRKGSAASSRRTSISSLQSSSQGGARASGPQSKHVAQHLRRASILADRKARLADQAAHAEKVRLRAAMAKSASRDTSVSETRALAAAQAREMKLAEIATSCAEEVKRAKAVAESIKEKRELEIQRSKLQMEERLAVAERRREELRMRNASKNRSRERGLSLMVSKSAMVEVMPQVKEVEPEASPMRADVAVLKIQWWWRGVRRRRVVGDFAGLGLSLEGIGDTSFEKVTELLSQENVLAVTAQVLRLCGLRQGEPSSAEEMAAVRTFLSAFVILGHPAEVLGNKSEQEQAGTSSRQLLCEDAADAQSQELVGKARNLLICFENMLSRLHSRNRFSPPPALLRLFPRVYMTFHEALIAWKARDSATLVGLMIMQFVELDGIWQSVKTSTDGSVDSVYRESIQNNQVMLLVRIKKLVGPARAKKMIADAVRKARKARGDVESGDTKPRVAETESAASILGPGEGDEPQPRRLRPSTPARDETGTAYVDIVNLCSILPSNRVIVHELAIDRNYRIEADQYRQQQAESLAPLFSGMRKTMQADDREAHFLLLLGAARCIRYKLQRLVKDGSQMHTLIGEVLDTDVARRQFSTGSFSYEKFFQAMGALLPKLCAPVRDGEVAELREKLGRGDYVERLQVLMAFIDLMTSDYANYLLQMTAQGIVKSAAPYENKWFGNWVQASGTELRVAWMAWLEAREKVHEEVTRREGVSGEVRQLDRKRIYVQMMVDLFVAIRPPLEGEMPEMLALDHERAVQCGRITRQIVTAGAILLQCKNLLKRDVRTPWKAEASRILAVLDKAGIGAEAVRTTCDAIMHVLEAGRCMPDTSRTHLRGLVTRCLVAVDADANDAGEPVLRLLHVRLRAHVHARLMAAFVSASERGRAASSAGERLASQGLVEFVDKVRDLVELMGRVGAVDREAHATWWDNIALQVEEVQGVLGSNRSASSDRNEMV